MGIAAYEISGHGKRWRIHHDGKSENVYETKEAAFELAVAAVSFAVREDHQLISSPSSDTANTLGGDRGVHRHEPHIHLAKRLQPMLATLTDAPFDDKGWVFEDKYDGFRMVATTQGGKVTLYSRNGKIISHSYVEVAKALEGVKGDAVIDGELVALDKNGISHFQLLQNALRHEAKLLYCAFDLMFLNGEDLRGLHAARSQKAAQGYPAAPQADSVQPSPQDIWQEVLRGSRAQWP